MDKEISIHILAQRMTDVNKIAKHVRLDFNPHPRTKDDPHVLCIGGDGDLFQSTSSHKG